MPQGEVKARQRFPHLSPRAFTHPRDTAALDALKQVRGLDYVTKKWIEMVGERILHIDSVSMRVLVGPRQCKELYETMRTAASILDMPTPRLYVEYNPIAQAFSYGVTHPVLVLTTGLVDLLDDEETLAVMGHELGHILCGHSLYRQMAQNIKGIMTFVGQATLGVGQLLGQGLVLALYEWYRKSEFSADRAGLLVCQNPETLVSVNMKFAGGTGKLARSLDRDQFLKQAEEYDRFDESVINIAYKVLQQVNLTHPIPILRAREIVLFSRDQQFHQINAGEYPRRATGDAPCDSCGHAATAADRYCPHCGAPRTGADAGSGEERGEGLSHCPSCFAAVPADLAACPVCGASV